MGVTFSTELIYLLIGIGVGTILGINIAVVFNRLFRKRSSREHALERQVKELEHRIRAKDRMIAKAVQASIKEEREQAR